MVETARLQLIPSDVAYLEAFLRDRAAFARLARDVVSFLAAEYPVPA